MPLRGNRSEEANCKAEGSVRVREWEEVRALWRSWRLQQQITEDRRKQEMQVFFSRVEFFV